MLCVRAGFLQVLIYTSAKILKGTGQLHSTLCLQYSWFALAHLGGLFRQGYILSHN